MKCKRIKVQAGIQYIKHRKDDIMKKRPKFSVGQTVFNKVTRRGSYEPSICSQFEKMKVNEIRKAGDTFEYVCGYDGYVFEESELMSRM